MKLFGRKKRKASASASVEKTLHANLSFTATEQYKLLRANLTYILPEDEKCPVIGVTSSMRGEGKSTTAINLSYVLAEDGKKVLLMDCDLRIPSVAKKLKLRRKFGVTDLVKRAIKAEIENLRVPESKNWYVLPAGELPPNPSELLGSKRMEALLEDLRSKFDYIIMDLPPVNIVSDAISVAKYISGVIVVVRQDHTEKRELDRCFRQLSLSGVTVLGCVMNETEPDGGTRGKYYGYSDESDQGSGA